MVSGGTKLNMAYTRQIVTSFTDTDYDRLYTEAPADEAYYVATYGWKTADVKANLKKLFTDAIANSDQYIVCYYDDDLLIQMQYITKTYELDGQQRGRTGHVLKAKNKSDTKSWIYDASIANSMTPTAKVLHAEQDVIGLFVETQTKDFYDAIKNGMNSDLNLTEISPYNPTTKIAVFVTDFGFD